MSPRVCILYAEVEADLVGAERGQPVDLVANHLGQIVANLDGKGHGSRDDMVGCKLDDGAAAASSRSGKNRLHGTRGAGVQLADLPTPFSATLAETRLRPLGHDDEALIGRRQDTAHPRGQAGDERFVPTLEKGFQRRPPRRGREAYRAESVGERHP